MNPRVTTVLLAVLLSIPAMVFGQEQKNIEIVQLNDHLYKLTYDVGYIVNIVASVGDDGILLVDTGEKVKAEELKKAVASFDKGIPKIIINTHAHVDHTGGNAIFGDDPIVIAHDILRTRLRSGSYLFDEFPDATLPDITFRDSLSLYFNGETIKLHAFPGSHDDNDILVLFTESHLVAAGDLLYTKGFPSYEEVTGGVLGYREVVPRILSILPEDIVIVTGHTSEGTIETAKAFHEAIVNSAEVVREEMLKGRSYGDMQQSDVLADWAHFSEGYVSLDEWLKELVDALEAPAPSATLYEPLYYALRDQGVDAAVAKYYDLKKNHASEYRFVDDDLMFMAGKLSKSNKVDAAIAFWSLCATEFPKSIYVWYCYYSLGKLYASTGSKDLAIENYEKSSELNPNNPIIQEKIKDLQGD
jgi:glyoxylase-like metal-dependent hydrolase (beta-lactamase superfamily II)